MVHIRLNATETNPNPHVNFITALPMPNAQSQEDAQQLLRALAAQVRPLMKAHGYSVNSLEEYEHNVVFAGRNWNAGETIELVLRSSHGAFLPTSWLMSTLCHELAHIKHMNHGREFQALWKQLRIEVRNLQNKGYYGDGYWSSGTRLADSTKVSGISIEVGDFPEYMCGGAQSSTRPARRRRLTNPNRKPRARKPVVPSLHTGRQTERTRKAGVRVRANVFVGQGNTLDDGGDKGSFGKKALSKRARDERAEAAEKRIRALQGLAASSTDASLPLDHFKTVDPPELEMEGEDEAETEDEPETDAERRLLLARTKSDDDFNSKLTQGPSWMEFEDEFNFPCSGGASGSNLDSQSNINGGDQSGSTDSFPTKAASTSSQHPQPTKGKGRARDDDDNDSDIFETHATKKSKTKHIPALKSQLEAASTLHSKSKSAVASKNTDDSRSLGLGKLVQTEIQLRKRENLGMGPTKGKGRTLGHGDVAVVGPRMMPSEGKESKKEVRIIADKEGKDSEITWTCLVCTLENRPNHLACSACSSAKGERAWVEA